MTFTPRYYQTEAVAATWAWMRANDGNPIIVLPTGAGKSFVLADLAREAVQGWPGTRVLILSHVRELLIQDYAALMQHWPEAPAGLYSAGLNKRDIAAQVLIAGIQSIHKRAYQVQQCDLVIIDEAHLIGRNDAGMYRRFLKQLREINSHMRVIGLTATAYRLDTGMLHEGEGALFDGIAYEAPLLDLIQKGYLCAVRAKATQTTLDVSGVGTRGGDYIQSQLEDAVDVDCITQAAVNEIVEKGHDRGSWLCFCSGIRHAEHVRDAIRSHGVSCEMISGETPTPQRDRILADFKAGRIRALTNMNCLTTGVDAPGIDLIAMLRPTKSLSLYVQAFGRGTRIAEGKDDCLILDFAGVTKLHGPLDLVDGRKKKAEGDGEPPVKVCPTCKEICAAASLICPCCGFEFPARVPKISAFAVDAPVLSIHAVRVWAEVESIRYARHAKEGKPDSLLVVYQCGIVQHREWVCIEHSGYPRQKAVDWWQRRAPGKPVPNTVADALLHASDLPVPAAISVKPVGKYTEIVGVKFN